MLLSSSHAATSVLQSGLRRSAAQWRALQSTILAGATGVPGNEMVRRLVGGGRMVRAWRQAGHNRGLGPQMSPE